MITITMQQLLDFRNNIQTFNEMVFPLKGAYKINKIKKGLEKETEFYAEKFQEILNTYGQKDENGNFVYSEDNQQILIVDGKMEECNNALEELQNLEIQVENYNLTLEDLGEDIECTPEELEALMPFMN